LVLPIKQSELLLSNLSFLYSNPYNTFYHHSIYNNTTTSIIMPGWSLEHKFQLLLIIISLNNAQHTVRATNNPELVTPLTIPSQDWDLVARGMSTHDKTYTRESVRYASKPLQGVMPR